MATRNDVIDQFIEEIRKHEQSLTQTSMAFGHFVFGNTLTAAEHGSLFYFITRAQVISKELLGVVESIGELRDCFGVLMLDLQNELQAKILSLVEDVPLFLEELEVKKSLSGKFASCFSVAESANQNTPMSVWCQKLIHFYKSLHNHISVINRLTPSDHDDSTNLATLDLLLHEMSEDIASKVNKSERNVVPLRLQRILKVPTTRALAGVRKQDIFDKEFIASGVFTKFSLKKKNKSKPLRLSLFGNLLVISEPHGDHDEMLVPPAALQSIIVTEYKRTEFSITTHNSREFPLRAHSKKEFDSWMKILGNHQTTNVSQLNGSEAQAPSAIQAVNPKTRGRELVNAWGVDEEKPNKVVAQPADLQERKLQEQRRLRELKEQGEKQLREKQSEEQREKNKLLLQNQNQSDNIKKKDLPTSTMNPVLHRDVHNLPSDSSIEGLPKFPAPNKMSRQGSITRAHSDSDLQEQLRYVINSLRANKMWAQAIEEKTERHNIFKNSGRTASLRELRVAERCAKEDAEEAKRLASLPGVKKGSSQYLDMQAEQQKKMLASMTSTEQINLAMALSASMATS